MKKLRKKSRYILATLLCIVGLALIFNGQISTWVVSYLTKSSLNTKITNKVNKNANFDFSKVKAISPQLLAKALKDKTGSIGRIAIPKVKLKLSIFYGISNTSLARGAGTMKKNEKMGKGNYALAGHHMTDGSVLFGPLSKVKVGYKIYLTDGKKVYIYRTIKKVRVYKSQVKWIYNVKGQKLVTLVTCASGTEGEVNRIIVRGKLVKTVKLTARYWKLFK